MGIDLALLPFDCDNKAIHFSHTILECNRDSKLFEKISRTVLIFQIKEKLIF